jgi:hypothetical protein
MKSPLSDIKAGLFVYGGMWVLGCSLCLYLSPSLMLDLPVWRASGAQPKAMLVLALAHAFASTALLYRQTAQPKPDFFSLVAFSLSACGVFTLYAYLAGIRKILVLLPWAISPPLLVGQILLLRSSSTRLFKIAAGTVFLFSLAFWPWSP